jgi:hypothetical protein
VWHKTEHCLLAHSLYDMGTYTHLGALQSLLEQSVARNFLSISVEQYSVFQPMTHLKTYKFSLSYSEKVSGRRPHCNAPVRCNLNSVACETALQAKQRCNAVHSVLSACAFLLNNELFCSF